MPSFIASPARPRHDIVPAPFRGLPSLAAALLAAALAGSLAGCASTRPEVSQDLAEAESLPVKKKLFILFTGERLDFGDWRVHKVKRDSSQSIRRPRHSRIEARLQEKYTFQVAQGGTGAWEAACLTDARRLDELPFFGPIQERAYQVVLTCDLRGPESGQIWRLDLVERDTSGRVLKGVLSNGREIVKVTGSRALGKTVREESHTSFEFAGQDRTLGAVVLARGNRVLLSPEAGSSRPALAAAAAALMLYIDSNQRMKDMVEARLQSERQMYL